MIHGNSPEKLKRTGEAKMNTLKEEEAPSQVLKIEKRTKAGALDPK